MQKKFKKREYKVEYVYNPSPDAEARINRAFDILFKDIDLYTKNGSNKNNKISQR